MLRKRVLLCFTGFLVIVVLISILPTGAEINYTDEQPNKPESAASLEGIENVLITKISREANITGVGLLNIIDTLEIKNLNNNPITSIFFSVSIDHSEDLVFFKATTKSKTLISSERTDLVMNDHELIAIYFETPLMPQQAKTIRVFQSFKDIIKYSHTGTQQQIIYQGPVFPALPYKAQGTIIAKYQIPEDSTLTNNDDWGEAEVNEISFNFEDADALEDYLEPFYGNMGVKENITIIYTDDTVTKLEVIEINREIFVSPWGIIKVKEDFLIQNLGPAFSSINKLHFRIPGPAKSVQVYDDLGEILGITIDPEVNYTNLEFKDLEIDLSENRVKITSRSKVKLTIEYHLPFEKHHTLNWFQESINISALTSRYDYLGRDQTIKVEIDGCYHVDYVSEPPDAIESTQTSTILIFYSDYVTPFDDNELQFTYTIHPLKMMLRILVFMLLIALVCSGYVLIIKAKEQDKGKEALLKEKLPIREIREFCSLYEDKNALALEIRKAEEEVARKKLPRKQYRNILDRNNARIAEIKEEIAPFKKVVRETNLAFKNIVEKLEIAETERESVNDSLKLLEARYRRGRLPSREVYERLMTQSLRRQAKIDRTIDRLIQSLRGYLI